jgi:hypothetical protein
MGKIKTEGVDRDSMKIKELMTYNIDPFYFAFK